LENDANAQALAMNTIYSPNSKLSIFFTISTGIGCGIIINGKIFSGQNGFAAEIANINTHDFSNYYGKLTNGSLESIASGTGLVYQANPLKKVANAKEIFANKDHHAKIIQNGEIALARLFNSAISFFDPKTIFIGGSVAINNPDYIHNALKICNKQLFKAVRGKQEIHFAETDIDYGIIGASML
jgi:glucokinase